MWVNFLTEYGMFLARFATVVIIFLALAFIVAMLVARARAGADEHLEVKNINQKFEHMQLMLQSAILPKKAFNQSVKEIESRHKAQSKAEDKDRRRIFVIHFKGDIRASEVSSLREEISAVLTTATTEDEVVVILESGGGTVHGYGLAAAQLIRVKNKKIKLTVAVDEVAASGGYMMACVADHIIAAPFAVIGSIGVLAQIPNFHRLLKRHDIDFEQISAGKHKRTLSLFGENTDEERAKLKSELEETHQLFKEFVKQHRERVDIEKIATGEHWYGRRALDFGLVDALQTSDDYLAEAVDFADIYEITFVRKKPLMEKFISSLVKMLAPN